MCQRHRVEYLTVRMSINSVRKKFFAKWVQNPHCHSAAFKIRAATVRIYELKYRKINTSKIPKKTKKIFLEKFSGVSTPPYHVEYLTVQLSIPSVRKTIFAKWVETSALSQCDFKNPRCDSADLWLKISENQHVENPKKNQKNFLRKYFRCVFQSTQCGKKISLN